MKPSNIRVVCGVSGSLAAVTLAVLLLPLSSVKSAGDDLPSWLRSASSATLKSYPKDVPAVVLTRESNITVDEDGRIVRNNFCAIKVLNREGRHEAVARELFNTDHEKVREMRAWLLSPSGKVRKYGKSEIAEVAAVENDIYNEARVMAIIAVDDAEPGAVFGYETVTEERSVFSQIAWYFQEDVQPVLKSRISVTLPKGWTADGLTLNHDKLSAEVAGNTYTWEMRDMPPIEDEPMSPSGEGILPWLAINLIQPADKPSTSGKRVFLNWADVATWLSELQEPAAVLDDALGGKARQLTSTSRSEIERIAAIGRYVQAVNYVSIQIGTGRGGGYRPHPATEVFAKSYGDCKDKANLMKSMLRAIGIKSYLVSIYSGDPNHVRQEWPSPHQFNHCIIAIAVSDETQAPTIIKHPVLGRLLMFDPTDDNTPVGDLPGHEQGSYALVVCPEGGTLLKMPVTPPEANVLSRRAEVTLGADGQISAKIHEESVGQAAVRERSALRSLAKPDYNKWIERRITAGASGAEVSKIEPADNAAEGKFSLDVEFAAANYGQVMQGRLLVFKPALARRESLVLTNGTRKHPVVLSSRADDDTIQFKLPAGFEPDELPDAVSLEAPFGSFKMSCSVKDGKLIFTRRLSVIGTTIPASEYQKVRGFFDRIGAAEQAPVVLARK
jgi:hypothetical protein